ncbi:MFS transporter [Chitinophagaceae bacterium LWZ2-11]
MKIKGLRWVVLSLVVLVTIINYLDRGTLNYMWIANTKHTYTLVQSGDAHKKWPYAVHNATNHEYVLFDEKGNVQTVDSSKVKMKDNRTIEYTKKGGIAIELGLVDVNASPAVMAKQSKQMLSYITMFFMVAYGASQLVSGKIYDKIGTRKGFVFSVLLWGLADMLTSFARGVGSLSFCRVMLGLGEAGPWPGAVKSNAEWFPVKERALAQGFFGAGGSIGSILAPIIISMLYITFGWKSTFIVVGSLGVLWLIPWLIINKKAPAEHPWITDEEKEHILSGQIAVKNVTEKGKTWSELLRDKKSYAVIIGRFFLDPVWWMFVTWLPIYLSEVFKLDIKQIAFSAWVPYVGAAIGAIAGGWFSGRLIKKGKQVSTARKIAVITGASIMLPAMIAAAFASTALTAVILMAFILGGFQFAVVNIQTLPGDYHSGKTVGSLAGLGGAAAVLGTLITMFLVPYITTNNNWVLFFVMGAGLVPIAVAAVFIFSVKNKQAIN